MTVDNVLVFRDSRRPLRGGDVGVYAGPGCGDTGRTAIQNFLDAAGLTWETLYPSHVNGDAFAGRYRALWIPGGFGGGYSDHVTAEGRRAIHAFVADGGGLLATCAGTYYSARWGVWEGNRYEANQLGIFPGHVEGAVDAIVPWDGHRLTPVALVPSHPVNRGRPAELEMLYWGGPEFYPEEPGLDVVGTFRVTGRPGIVAHRHDCGRVFLMAPHAELGYDEATGEFDYHGGHGAQWEWLEAAARWAMGEADGK